MTYPATETPTTAAGPPPRTVFDPHFTTAAPPPDIHKAGDDVIAKGGGDDEQFWISIETHQMLLVTAPTIESAIAKAVVNFEGNDPDITEVSRDVHTCAHGSEDAHDEYDAHGGEMDEEAD